MKRRCGTIHLSQALLLGPLPALFLAWMQDWYVDVNAPGCGTGTGTETDPFCDIMDAVAVAADGDTIHIAPGTYFENVVLDRELNLIGTGGRDVTILDGGGNGSVVWVLAPATLDGLTLTNGTGVERGDFRTGGGVCIEFGFEGPVCLTDCSVTGNMADSGSAIWNDQGVGPLCCYTSGPTGPLNLSNCTIKNNASPWHLGAAISKIQPLEYLAQGSLTVSDSEIQDNSSTFALWYHSETSSLTLSNTSISRNGGYGIRATSFPGRVNVDIYASEVRDNLRDGLIVDSVAITIRDTTISGNSWDGIRLWYTTGTISNSTVTGNAGGGVSFPYGDDVALINSTISDNSGEGVTVGSHYGSSASIANCTITRNGGGALHVAGSPGYGYASHATLRNSILWDNRPNAISLSGAGATVAVDHSLIEGGWPGVGNLDTDPLFADSVNGNYRLQPGSPCIDAGDNHAVPPGIWTDLDGKRRFIDGTGAGLGWHKWPFVDMGAYEFGNGPPPKVRQR